MSLRLPQQPNQGLFKQGYNTQSAADGATLRNIQACGELALMVATLIGPCGRNKIIVNHLGKVVITLDALTIITELDVVHPAVKLVVMASRQQEYEMGDFLNLVIGFAGELLKQLERLLTLGMLPGEIGQGFKAAQLYVGEHLADFAVDSVADVHSKPELLKVLVPVVAAKQFGHEHLIAGLIADAVLAVLPPNPLRFNVDSIRVVKVMGALLAALTVINGMVFPQEPVLHLKEATAAKVVVFSCPIDISATETKGTVLLHNAQEMLDFSKGEEQQVDQVVKEIAATGVKVVVAGSTVGELFLHYANVHGLVVLKVPLKFDLRRISRVCGATPLARLGAPLPDECGSVAALESKEIGGDRVCVFRQEPGASHQLLTSTIVVRGATTNALEDIERVIDDGVLLLKGVLQDPALLPGAGAVEVALVRAVTAWGEQQPGLTQLAVKAYAKALEVVPRCLAETAGLDATEVVLNLYAGLLESSKHLGVDVEGESDLGTVDAVAAGVFDLLVAKKNAYALATEAAATVLSVDSIIMAKRAGGPAVPKGPRPGNWDSED